MNKIKNKTNRKKEIGILICACLCLFTSLFGIFFTIGVIYLLEANILSWFILASFILIFIVSLYILIFWSLKPEIDEKTENKEVI